MEEGYALVERAGRVQRKHFGGKDVLERTMKRTGEGECRNKLSQNKEGSTKKKRRKKNSQTEFLCFLPLVDQRMSKKKNFTQKKK